MIRTDDGHEKENLAQESVLYFDSPEQAEVFINAGRRKAPKLKYQDLGEGRVGVRYE